MPEAKAGAEASINYRHIIRSLVRKPGAFKNYVYRDHLFPSQTFKVTHDMLVKHYPVHGTKQYLQILELAAMGSENEVERILGRLIKSGKTPSFIEIEEQIKLHNRSVNSSLISAVKIITPALESYDLLLKNAM
jgi:hypothetical protein